MKKLLAILIFGILLHINVLSSPLIIELSTKDSILIMQCDGKSVSEQELSLFLSELETEYKNSVKNKEIHGGVTFDAPMIIFKDAGSIDFSAKIINLLVKFEIVDFSIVLKVDINKKPTVPVR